MIKITKMKKQIALFSIAFIFIGLQLFAQDKNFKKQVKEFDKYCELALDDWNVPGMAVAIVKDGETVFAKGYGVTNSITKEKVNENTLFAIASNSKSFTAASLAILVDKGEIKWDDKVQKYLPWFQLYNPYVSANMTIRDLLCHRSGLKTFAGDLLWYGTKYSRKEVVERAKFLKPTYGFRTHFGYSNIMYLAAGLIVEEVSGQTWDQFITTNFFTPLNMNRTQTSILPLANMENVAAPHNIVNDSVFPIVWQNWDNIAPAGSIISSANDMTAWMRLQLNRGIFENDTIFSKKSSHQMWTQQIAQNVSSRSKNAFPSTSFKGYGLGWSLYNYYGKKIVQHGGGYDGMLSMVSLIPEENLGIVVLTNQNEPLYYAIAQQALDIFLNENKSERDWSKMLLPPPTDSNNSATKTKEENIEKVENHTLPLEEYCGTYGGDIYGDAIVSIKNNKLHIDLLPTTGFESELKHKTCNAFSIKMEGFPSLPEGVLNFLIDEKGDSYKLTIYIPNPDFDFGELEFNKID